MNIEDDYLWDRTGEPDPEVQQLEEILGTLRHQPRPLRIPAGLQVDRERNFFRGSAPRLAIAATIAMLLLGLGLWLGVQRLQRNRQQEITVIRNTPQVQPNPVATPAHDEKANSSPADEPRRHRVNQTLLARNSSRSRNASVKQQLAAKQKQAGEAAKDQLMLALRVASAKLNFAQRKAQSTNPRDLIHNQHKIG